MKGEKTMIELIGEVKKYMALFLILKKASLNKVINERYITKEHNGSVKTKALYYETYDEFDITAVEDGIRKTIPPRVYSDKNSYEYAMKNAYLHKKIFPYIVMCLKFLTNRCSLMIWVFFQTLCS
jgi:hypothetical protein